MPLCNWTQKLFSSVDRLSQCACDKFGKICLVQFLSSPFQWFFFCLGVHHGQCVFRHGWSSDIISLYQSPQYGGVCGIIGLSPCSLCAACPNVWSPRMPTLTFGILVKFTAPRVQKCKLIQEERRNNISGFVIQNFPGEKYFWVCTTGEVFLDQLLLVKPCSNGETFSVVCDHVRISVEFGEVTVDGPAWTQVEWWIWIAVASGAVGLHWRHCLFPDNLSLLPMTTGIGVQHWYPISTFHAYWLLIQIETALYYH